MPEQKNDQGLITAPVVPEKALLQVQGLSVCVNKNGNQYKILDNISFNIKEGEILGLAGESGCGKSMSALSIAGLLPDGIKVTEGNIIYNNKNISALNEKKMCGIRGSEISLIFQDVRQSLNPLMKVGRQITETLSLDGRQRDGMQYNSGYGNSQLKRQKRQNQQKEYKVSALEILSSLGFDNPEKIFDGYPHQLSGGMCQRVMTAIAVIRRPKLLLADEPSSSLDEESQQRCISLLKEMNEKHRMSLLIISHDLSIIHKFTSRYLIMYSGKIMEEGPSKDLFSPLHPYTQALVKAMPNKEKKGSVLENIPGRIPSVEEEKKGCPFAARCIKAQNICRETLPGVKEKSARKTFCHFAEES